MTLVPMLDVAAPSAHAAPPQPAVEETKEQHDARMAWWRDARFGMFIHWGLYAEAGGEWNGKQIGGIGEWIMYHANIPVADYKALAAKFNPQKFDADAWVQVAKNAGMKYIVITAKHHDGFAMYKSNVDAFNIVDATPFKRDPLAELLAAARRHNIPLGFYYSQDQDWTAPGGGINQKATWDDAQKGDFAKYFRTKAIPQVKELLSNYPGAPVVLWFDTPSPKTTPELAAEMIEVLKQHPNIIYNNRLGGGFRGDTETPEQHIPRTGYPGRDWETCMTINETWGYKKNDLGYKSTEKLLRNLIDIASKGGNYLLNVGPTPLGEIPSQQIECLQAVGEWLKVNGESIYGTQAGPFPRDLGWGRATQGKGGRLWLHVFAWPKDGKLTVPLANKITKATLVAAPDRAITAENTPEGLVLTLTGDAPDKIASVISVDLQGTPDVIPPPPVAQLEDGTVPLTLDEVTLVNTTGKTASLRIQGSDKSQNVGYWKVSDDAVQWRVAIRKPGKYSLKLTYAALASNDFVLTYGPQSGEGTKAISKGRLEATGNWRQYTTVTTPATVEVTQPATLVLTLKPENLSGAFCDLREAALVPVSSN